MPALFSKSTLEHVREASDIVEVIGSYLPLKRAGANFRALCPFHKEKTPSFNVNPQRQIFHCFGCHKGGDVFSFLREYENISFTEAVRRLADRAGIHIEYEKDSAASSLRSLKENLYNIHEAITKRWQHNLLRAPEAEPAREYLQKRGITDDAIRTFRIGYAPKSWDDTINWAKSKNIDITLLEKGGLIKSREDGRNFYDRFRDRVIFPVSDEQGRVIGFSGRALEAGEKNPKYINSPETPIFHKRKVFYGLDKSKRHILDAQAAILCEGQLDLIACFCAGIQNIVAPQGTSCTADHARIIKRFTDEVILCFDSDAAGQSAAIRALDDLLESGLAVRVAVIPSPDDPDSFIKTHGADAFRSLINRAQDFFDFYLDHLCNTNNAQSDKGKLAILFAMGSAARKTGNAVLIDKCAQSTAIRLGVDTTAVRTEFSKISPKYESPTNITSPPEDESKQPPPPPANEFWLLKLLFQDDIPWDWVSGTLNPDWLQHPSVSRIISTTLRYISDGGIPPEISSLLNELEDEYDHSILTQALSDPRPIPQPFVQLKDLILKLRNLHLDRQITPLRTKLDDPNLPNSERDEILIQQHALRIEKSRPLPEISSVKPTQNQDPEPEQNTNEPW